VAGQWGADLLHPAALAQAAEVKSLFIVFLLLVGRFQICGSRLL